MESQLTNPRVGSVQALASLPPTSTLPTAGVEVVPWASPWTSLIPLWRLGVWFAIVFVVAAASVTVRLDVARLQKDLARNAVLFREAQVLNERLQLEWDVRRRTAAVEFIASHMSMSSDLTMVPVEPASEE